MTKPTWDETREKIMKDIDGETYLAVADHVIRAIVDHAHSPGSFRYLIYDRLGFGPEAYVPLYNAGGMTITNEFDLSHDEAKTDAVRELCENLPGTYEVVRQAKSVFGLCDEPGCFERFSYGFPTPEGYRKTCGKHFRPLPAKQEDQSTDRA